MSESSKPSSPYLKPGRLQEVIAAIQAMSVAIRERRSIEDWQEKLGDPSSAVSWVEIFGEHPEFFSLHKEDTRASLKWRRAYNKCIDRMTGERLSRKAINELRKPQRDKLARPSLSPEQIHTLISTAIELHARAIEQNRESRWWLPTITAIFAAVASFAGVILGVWLKN